MARKEDFENLVFEKLGEGFVFTEGPVWFEKEGYLLFSDIDGDAIRRWSPERGVEIFRAPSNEPNGSARDKQGRFLSCEHKLRGISRTEADGTVTPLITHYQGKRLNSPNDVIVKSDGKIYFTDPCSGITDYDGNFIVEPDLDFCGVYMFDDETKQLTLLTKSVVKPNGLAFSPDEKILYVDDTNTYHIHAFDVKEDGTLENDRIIADAIGGDNSRPELVGGPDGMKVDSEGNLYVAGEGNVIYVISPEGEHITMIPSPNGEFTSNFTWGDDDRKTLYICASSELYRVRMPIAGCRTTFVEYPEEDSMPEHWAYMNDKAPELLTQVFDTFDALDTYPALTAREQQLITFAMMVAAGKKEAMGNHAGFALEEGATEDQLFGVALIALSMLGVPAYSEAIQAILKTRE